VTGTAYRTLHQTSPLLHGGDVVHFQRDLNWWFERWHVKLHLDDDGDYGEQTREAFKLVAHGLGIDWRDGATPEIRRKIRDPKLRSQHELKIAAGRSQWRHRLKYRFDDDPVKLFVEYLHSQVGVTESPPGSNRGPKIDAWNRAVGTAPGPDAYWCGALQNAGLVAAGFANNHRLAYCPYIEADARGGIGGWRWYGPDATPQVGWLALFTEKGIAGHVEGVVEAGHPLRTIGGNTSKGDGSPNNGGVVAYHDFSEYHGLPLRGFAAPPFKALA
jgi:hypothetical protein